MGLWVCFRDPHYGSYCGPSEKALARGRSLGWLARQAPAVEARNSPSRAAFLFRKFESMRQLLLPIQFTVALLNFSLRIFQDGSDLVTERLTVV
jgi:hypothetical protein